MKKTKVLLIWPRGGSIQQGIPLSFGSLKSNTDKKRYKIMIIDCTLENLDPSSPVFIKRLKKANPKVVGVSSWSYNYPEALAVFKIVKENLKNVVTIYGGPHASAVGNTIKNKDIDFVFRGEAELSFQLFLDELKKAKPCFSKIRGLIYANKKNLDEKNWISKLDDVKFPDYNFINLDGYIKAGYSYQGAGKRNAPIWTTRGCPYNCRFCAVSGISGRVIRKHSIGYLIKWIKYLYQKHNIRGFNIIDDNFTFDIDHAKEFCREVIKLGYKDISFNCPNGVRMQRGDLELWNLMKQAGWKVVVVAPESGSRKVLQSMGKALDAKEVPGYVSEIKKSGLKVNGFFMMNYPGETRSDLKKTEELIRKCKFNDVAISMFQPEPGAQIYDQLVKDSYIPDNYLPANFGTSKGNVYISPSLKGFDFDKFRLRMIIITFLNNPLSNLNRNLKRILSNPSTLVSIPWKILKVSL